MVNVFFILKALFKFIVDFFDEIKGIQNFMNSSILILFIAKKCDLLL